MRLRLSRGFTLIELMITVAIVAILAAIVIPSYSEYVKRSDVTEAVSSLSSMRVKMEQYFQDNRSYAGACAANTVAPTPPATANFTYACNPAPDATTYTVVATGTNAMAGASYTIDQNNVRTTVSPPNGWQVAGNTCWVLRKDGSC